MVEALTMFGNQSQFKQQKYQQFEVRKTGYGQTWNTELKTACCADPGCKFRHVYQYNCYLL